MSTRPYFDGRYFDACLKMVAEGYKYFSITLTFNTLLCETASVECQAKPSKTCINLIRLILQGEEMKHSTLLVYNPGKRCVHWWNPRSYGDGNEQIHSWIKSKIMENLRSIFGGCGTFIDIQSPIGQHNMCNAYVLKACVDICNHKLNVNNWSKQIYHNYDIDQFADDTCSYFHRQLDAVSNEPDVEYDFSPMGAAGGALVGGLVLGGLGGAAIGGLAGGTIGGMHDKYIYEDIDDYHHYDGMGLDYHPTHYVEDYHPAHFVEDYHPAHFDEHYDPAHYDELFY